MENTCDHPAERRKARTARLIECYKAFARSEEGQVILEDLMDVFHITGPIVGPDQVFQEGERNVVLYILSRADVKLGVKYE